MRTSNQRVLAKADAAAAVAAGVGHDGAGVADFVGCAALGCGGGDLVFFARHFEEYLSGFRVGLGGCEVEDKFAMLSR